MNEKILAIMVVYQIGFLFTFIAIMITAPSEKLSGLKGHLAYILRLLVWPYGLYYYTLRGDTQQPHNNSR